MGLAILGREAALHSDGIRQGLTDRHHFRRIETYPDLSRGRTQWLLRQSQQAELLPITDERLNAAHVEGNRRTIADPVRFPGHAVTYRDGHQLLVFDGAFSTGTRRYLKNQLAVTERMRTGRRRSQPAIE